MTDPTQHSNHSFISARNESDNDDIWGDDDNVSYDRAIAERDWSRMNDTFGSSGYREGIEEGKEEMLQQGFNQGWSEGVQYGHQLGKLRGLISPLLEYIKSTSASSAPPSNGNQLHNIQDKEAWIRKASELIKELIDLDIDKVFDKAFFDDGRRSTSSKSLPAADSSCANTSGSGCCGGSSSPNKDSCCKSGSTVVEPAEFDDMFGSDSQKSSTSQGGCCSSKNSTDSDGHCSKEKSNSKDGCEEALSSKPDQVINNYRSRVRELLKEVGLESLLDPA
ncbi:hypothetical protein BGX27_001348 [Mortierella sp. AM989]|nr:hypothetical protein BGX27_001348 [Mortierella sp. AM989]